MGALTREDILARKVRGDEKCELPGGGYVTVRGLTRNEVLAMQKLDEVEDKSNLIISMGMTDPTMTPDQVAEWAQSDDAGTLTIVSEKIQELSNLREGAGKSGVSRTRRRS